MTRSKNDDACVLLIVLIVIIVIIGLAVTFWYVTVPIILLIGYIYYRSKNKFPTAREIKQITNEVSYEKSYKESYEEKREIEKNFESLLIKSKELVDDGWKCYSKKDFGEAINNWQEAINQYQLAMEKSPSSHETKKIKENLKIIKENLSKAYIENGRKHNINAKEEHEKQNFIEAEKEWKSSKHDFETAIDLIKSEKIDISCEDLKVKIKSIELFLRQLEIEQTCLEIDKTVENARSLADKNLTESIKITNSAISQYVGAKKMAEETSDFQELVSNVQSKIIDARNFLTELQNKMDELIGITPRKAKVMIDDTDDKITTVLKIKKIENVLSILREYEFIGGQVRFKVALKNNTTSPLTNLKINFDIPKALKWIFHEPDYERLGDSILIPKLGKKEKKAVSLYLEPINCMESPVNATISFHDADDKPRAITMEPKVISITCPIFFTEEKANMARVKNLWSSLNHHDRKVFPIINPEKTSFIFETIISTLEMHDIKLVSKKFSDKDKSGEAWYYATTKVGKNRIVSHIIIDASKKKLEFRVSGDNEDQITAFLAEIGNNLRERLIEHDIVSMEDKFYDINVSVLSSTCPYCGDKLSSESVQKYRQGQEINCKYCNELIKVD